jgi:hypothetical protein
VAEFEFAGLFQFPHVSCQSNVEADMKRPLSRVIAVPLLLSFALAAKVPVDAWQTGTLIGSDESWHSRTVGTINSGSGVLVGREYPIVHYVIDTVTYTYDADLVLRHRRDKQPAVTVNGPIKYTFVKADMYIQDEGGREIKLRLTKKTLKQGN